MDIQEALEKLHKVYLEGAVNLGCVDRAIILYYIIKSKDLNPFPRLISFRDGKGEKIIPSHAVVILNNVVYDSNIEPSNNPIKLKDY